MDAAAVGVLEAENQAAIDWIQNVPPVDEWLLSGACTLCVWIGR